MDKCATANLTRSGFDFYSRKLNSKYYHFPAFLCTQALQKRGKALRWVSPFNTQYMSFRIGRKVGKGYVLTQGSQVLTAYPAMCSIQLEAKKMLTDY